MKRILLAGLLASGFFSGAGWAQEGGVWLQVEALPTLSRAEARARAYAGRFEDVSGYALGSGWYGIALGPYDPAEARRLLGELKAQGAVPGDAFIADGDAFRSRFWPAGAAARAPGASARVASDAAEPTEEAAERPVEVAAQAAPEAPTPPEETLPEARASEAALSRAERERLQVALRWAGVYDAGIDGAFGAGTRAAMAEWQRQNGFEATGVMTTRQRAALVAAYNGVLEGIGMGPVTDEAAGIAIDMPRDLVRFAEHRPPFAIYEAAGEVPAQVLLISQRGDANRLAGLYEILQTLEIIPREGPRGRNETGFVIEGAGETFTAHAEARLENGEIKGFVLVWPAGDEGRRKRVLDEMKASFVRLPGTLDPAEIAADDAQAIDLVAGLEIRQPLRERSGVFVDEAGAVATVAEAVAGCGEVAIDGIRGAEVLMQDAALGLALLRPARPVAPRGVAQFQTATPRLQDKVAVAGFPYGDALSVPALTFGRLADIRGLDGREEVSRLELRAEPGDAGGPVLDGGGAVLGLLLPGEGRADRQLPEEVALALEAGAILPALDAAGIAARTTDTPQGGTPEALTRRAAEMTALVSCWE
ncbi:trypsin-like peptidase domain-containing protein [Limimaricola pyoseonensis]|nr:trypsin-like peptidase domain-containing protein [Limimaricola pyoseonensis]